MYRKVPVATGDVPRISWRGSQAANPGHRRVVLVAQLVSRHSRVADRLPVVVRFPAGPRVGLKTVDPPKGNGLGPKKKRIPDIEA